LAISVPFANKLFVYLNVSHQYKTVGMKVVPAKTILEQNLRK